MSYYNTTPEGRDPQLWRIAEARASFRTHLVTYLIINAFLWALWFFGNQNAGRTGIPWPAFASFGWGIGLVFHYLGAFVFTKSNSVEQEYEKLVNKNKQ